MSNPFVTGPIAPESNPPINPQYFEPSQFFITAITLGNTTTVTTSVDHNYIVGQTVRLLIPFNYGSYQLNEQQGQVISIPAADQVVINIDSVNSNLFNANPSFGTTLPQIIAIGDVNSGIISSGGRVTDNSITGPTIPGSFINISP